MVADQTAALALLLRITASDEEALILFHRQFVNLVFSVAVRTLGSSADAEEVTQDVFMNLWRKAAQFDASKGSVTAWLLTMTRRKAIDHFRARRGDDVQASPLDEFENIIPSADTSRPRDLDLQRAMFDLPGEQRECLEMIYFGGFTQEEAAQRLALPLGTVKSRVRLAVGKLRTALVGHDQSKTFTSLVMLCIV